MCSNAECGSTADLKIAPSFVCSYFGLNYDPQRRRKICQSCFDDAEEHQNTLVRMLQEHKSLILGPKKPRNQLVTLDEDVTEEVQDDVLVEVQLEGELSDLVNSLTEKYKFEDQVSSSVYHLEKRWEENHKKLVDLGKSHIELEKQLDNFRKELYKIGEPTVEQLDPIEFDELGNTIKPLRDLQISPNGETAKSELPPMGTFKHTALSISDTVYAMRSSLLAPWGKARILKIKNAVDQTYDVRFEHGGKPRSIPLKYLAYATPSPVQLEVGSRVIAQYMEESDGKLSPSSFYAGVIAESPKYLNRFRYLIFFDDGYAQYCTHEQVMMVCQSSRDVWHDIHVNSRSFISSYLKQYPERAMVKLLRGQLVKTELNGHWFQSRVDSIDASLARIHFSSQNRYEWIYRGSTRLHPLFELLANAEARKNQGATRPTHDMALVNKKRNAPYVEYTRGDADQPAPIENKSTAPAVQKAATASDTIRAVARKSTSQISKVSSANSIPTIQSTDSILNAEHKGRIKHIINPHHHHVVFEPHQCNFKCIEEFPYSDGELRGCNPLSIPMLRGWSREITKQRNCGRRNAVYRAPCGRRLRNMDEVHRYLRVTGSELGVDLFCFDIYVHCFTEFEPDIVLSEIKDITYGKESVRVSCVNSIERCNPEYVEYCTKREPRPGVNLNLDPDFLVCCDCTDDCQDKEKCQCWQLTVQATACTSGKVDPNAGYQYRRLMTNVRTGIYECNSRCACRKTCLNRVAQRPLKLRLQLFRTEKRGWGIRSLDDIPKGEFICVYAGQLLTEQEANEDGKTFGDEYLAELDFIETIERAKEGYESDVTDIEEEAVSEASRSSNSGDESSTSNDQTELYRTKKPTLFPTQPMQPVSSSSKKKNKSENPQGSLPLKTRELFGPEEHCYVMDAKSTGNIGRYLNHSCKPNVFVQNIFVDTQDLRFPWVGFFAQTYIRAGTELTWDYSYQVGSVPDKILYCHCGSKDCRGRLL